MTKVVFHVLLSYQRLLLCSFAYSSGVQTIPFLVLCTVTRFRYVLSNSHVVWFVCLNKVINITVVNPLTVAYNMNGKARLVLDCRHVKISNTGMKMPVLLGKC